MLYYKCKTKQTKHEHKKQEELKMKTAEKVSEIVTVKNSELLRIIEDRQSYKNMVDELQSIIKQMDSAILQAVEDSGSNTILVGEHKVTVSKYTRESVSAKDVKKFVSEEVFEQLVSRTMSTRLTVK